MSDYDYEESVTFNYLSEDREITYTYVKETGTWMEQMRHFTYFLKSQGYFLSEDIENMLQDISYD